MAEMTRENFFEYLDGVEKQESGGGGIVCQATFDIGYKTFIGGLGNAESWFPVKPGDDESKKQALSQARAQIAEHGSGTRAQMSYCFRLKKDTVLGRAVAWQDDRWFVNPVWTAAAKQVVKPALRELDIWNAPLEFWGRFVWTDDPSGRTELDQDGNTRVALIAYPAERYASQAEAEAAAGATASAADIPFYIAAVVKEAKATNLKLDDLFEGDFKGASEDEKALIRQAWEAL